ncbi:hypothetical protein GOP47_0030331 [Adiantum capillus-veneris]|nr:hypothetical protein GOP47_0030331 [Adiantum capillus-veneris]
MKNFLGSARSLRRLLFRRETHIERGGRPQADSSKVGAPNERFSHVSGYVESGRQKVAMKESLQGSRSLWIYKHRQCRRMGLQSDDFYGIPAGEITPPPGQRPAMLAGRLNTRYSLSTFAWSPRIHSCLDHAGKRPSLESSWGYCHVSTVAYEPVKTHALEAMEMIAEERCDYAYSPDNARKSPSTPALKEGLIPLDELSNLLFTACTDPESVDLNQVRLRTSRRFHRSTSDTFISDLQQKLSLLKLPPHISKTLLKKRGLLFSSPEHLQAMLKVLEDFFDSREKACSILVSNPFIIGKTLEHLQQVLNVVGEFQIKKEIVERSCEFLRYNVDRTRDVLTFLESWGVHAASRNMMFSKNSQFVRYPLKDYVYPVVNFLESISMSKAEVVGLLEEHPDILGRSVPKNLMPKHSLCKKLGWNFIEVLPYIKYHSYARILSQIEFFKEQGVSDEAIIKLVEREPRVLGKSMDSLKTRLDFLLHTHNRSIAEIVSFPACLLYSFKNRIKPRLEFLEKSSSHGSFGLAYVLAIKSCKFRTAFKVPESVFPI